MFLFIGDKRSIAGMMNGNYGGGWMGGGWMMIIGVLVCFAIVVAVVWLVMRWTKE